MNKWKITFDYTRHYYLLAMTVLDVVKLIPQQNWNEDAMFITNIEIEFV